MRIGILSILQTNSEVFPVFWELFLVFVEDVPGFLGCSGFFGCSVFLETLHAAFKSSIYIFLHGSIDICVFKALFIWSRVPETTLPLEITLRSVYMEL